MKKDRCGHDENTYPTTVLPSRRKTAPFMPGRDVRSAHIRTDARSRVSAGYSLYTIIIE